MMHPACVRADPSSLPHPARCACPRTHLYAVQDLLRVKEARLRLVPAPEHSIHAPHVRGGQANLATIAVAQVRTKLRSGQRAIEGAKAHR